jgi:hypothetical protein
MRAAVRVGVAVVFMAALLGGCSSGTSDVPKSFKELQARIVTKIPAGFVAQSPDAYDTGPSNLAKAIRDDGEPNAGKVLRAEKFVRGYQRIWIGPEHDQIIVFLYQFESWTGARQEYARYTHGYKTIKPPPGAHTFAVPGVPSSESLGLAQSDNTGAAARVFFTKGVFNVQIHSNARRIEGLQSQITAIAKDQYNRL